MKTTTFLQIADNAFRKKPCSSLRPRFITEISYIQLTNWLVVGGGFEPPKASPTDLQSVPFDHSGTPPERLKIPSPKTSRHARFDDAITRDLKWSQRRDSNPRPTDYKSVALPAELRWHIFNIYNLLQINSTCRQTEKINEFRFARNPRSMPRVLCSLLRLRNSDLYLIGLFFSTSVIMH